jgi:hypothetical protein
LLVKAKGDERLSQVIVSAAKNFCRVLLTMTSPPSGGCKQSQGRVAEGASSSDGAACF